VVQVAVFGRSYIKLPYMEIVFVIFGDLDLAQYPINMKLQYNSGWYDLSKKPI
jgi:hypothetical protein